ncbi:hypothetical protein [Myroides odoratimimus]|uniref:hypothetical protein n=1 Tax=Myroides odoratimimus TaxID=76832 RepID=UPI00310149B5
MLDFFLNKNQYFVVGLSLLMALVTGLFSLRNRVTNKLNFFGYLLIVFSGLLFMISAGVVYYDQKKIKNDDIIVEISLRALKNHIEISKFPEDLPKNIFSPLVKIDKAETSGIFEMSKNSMGMGKASISTFVYYKCYLIDRNDDNFPKFISEINPEKIEIHLALKEIIQNNYTLNGSIKMKIRSKTYEGVYDSNNNVIRFNK